MICKAFGIGAIALASFAATEVVDAQTPAGNKPTPPDFSNPVGKSLLFPDFVRPLVKIQYPGNVEAVLDVPYANVTGYRPLTLDIYRGFDTEPKPAIIFVHGGSYVGGDPRSERSPVFGENDGFLAYVASRGYVVIAVSYRLADEAKWPAQLQDVKAAVRWVRGNAGKYGVNPERIGIWGESAGGHIAAMVGTTCNIQEFDTQKNDGIYGNPARGIQDKFADQSSCVRATVAWSASTDFAMLDAQNEAFARLIHNSPASSQSRVLGCALGTTCEAATVERASAPYYVGRGGADKSAFLLAAGTRDEATPWQQSQILYDALRTRRIPAQLHLVKDTDHYFIGATKDQARELLDVFFAFLNKHLGSSAGNGAAPNAGTKQK